MEQEKTQKQRVADQKDLFIIRAINTAVTKILENPYEGTGTLSADPENKKVTFNHVGYTDKEKNISVTLNGFYQNTTMGDLSISITNLSEGTTINGEAHTHVYNNITDTKKGITVLSENYIDGYLLVRGKRTIINIIKRRKEMKKISSILVLMLIALMLFVSCNGSTPTKEESNSSSNGSTPTVTERAATDEDYDLFKTLSIVLIEDLTNRETLPEGCTKNQVEDTSIFTFNSCEFDSYNLDGSTLHVKLNGNATIRAEGEKEENVDYYLYNITEGSSIGSIKYTLNTEYSMNNNTYTFNIKSIKINDVKIEGFDELANKKSKRVATPEDAVIAKKLFAAFNHLELTPGLINSLIALKQLEFVEKVDNVSNTTYTYTFKNNCSFPFPLDAQECNVVFNGKAEEYYPRGSAKVTFVCELRYGTKIDGTNHSIFANIEINNSNPKTYNIQTAIIDYTMVTGLNELIR